MYRRVLGLLLALLLFVPAVAGQVRHERYRDAGADDDAALAPIQAILEAAPTIVRRTIQEATFDGTPDEGRELVQALRTFAQGLPEDPRWPALSTSPALQERAFVFGNDLANVLADVPQGAQTVARTEARCEAWGENATREDRRGWALETWPAFQRLSGVSEGLRDLVDEVPRRVDPSPLERASSQLSAWVQTQLVPAQECLPPPSVVFLEVRPDTTWPGGRVILQGGVPVSLRNQTITITSASLSASVQTGVGQTGGFLERYTVPEDADLGRHTFELTVGNATGTTNLTLERAPSRLEVTRTIEALPGEVAHVAVRVISPLADAVGPGPVEMTGAVTASILLSSSEGRTSFEVPNVDGPLELRLRYPGSDLVEPSVATTTIRVLDPESQTPSSATGSDGRASGPGGSLKGGSGPPIPVLPGPGSPSRFGDAVPGSAPFLPVLAPDLPGSWPVDWPGLLIPFEWVLILVALAGFGWFAWREARESPQPEPGSGSPAPRSGILSISRRRGSDASFQAFEPFRKGVLAGFASIVRWLRSHGRVRPSQTVREIRDSLHQEGMFSEDVVDAFERERYDPLLASEAEQGEPAESSERARGLVDRLDALWSRLKEVVR